MVGLLAGTVGWTLGLPRFEPVGLTVVLVLATALEWGIRLPRPQQPRQVPSRWRSSMHPFAFTWLYGLLLGGAVFTPIPHATLYVVLVAASMSGPFGGALILGVYGAFRAAYILGFLVVHTRDPEMAALRSTATGTLVRDATAAVLAALTLAQVAQFAL
jgi:hypothetical protein